MKDYFDWDMEGGREQNDRTFERAMNRSRCILEDALKYDREFINEILNLKGELSEADKNNIANVVAQLTFEYGEMNSVEKSFHDFLMEVMGVEWMENISAKWLQRHMNEFADKIGAPEMRNNKGIYLYRPGEEEQPE